ncbi:MAG: hypothetical protein LBK56_05485 [Gracilibacteraceae bacterium]|nr:hypothetical protein [Gracilibacteraceae bacterium]
MFAFNLNWKIGGNPDAFNEISKETVESVRGFMAFVKEKIPESGPERDWLESFHWESGTTMTLPRPRRLDSEYGWYWGQRQQYFLNSYVAVEHGVWYIDRKRNAFFLVSELKKKKEKTKNITDEPKKEEYHCAMRLVIGSDELDIYAEKTVWKDFSESAAWGVQPYVLPEAMKDKKDIIPEMIAEICGQLSGKDPFTFRVRFAEAIPAGEQIQLALPAVLFAKMLRILRGGRICDVLIFVVSWPIVLILDMLGASDTILAMVVFPIITFGFVHVYLHARGFTRKLAQKRYSGKEKYSYRERYSYVRNMMPLWRMREDLKLLRKQLKL